MNKLKDTNIEDLHKLKVMSDILRSSVISLSGEMADGKATTELFEQNKEELTNVFTSIKAINTEVATILDVYEDVNQGKLFDEDGNSIKSGYTKATEEEIQNAKSPTVGPQPKTEEKKDETKTQSQSTNKETKKDKKVETSTTTSKVEKPAEIKRCATKKEALDIIAEDIYKWVKDNNFEDQIRKGERPPQDMRVLWALKAFKTVPLKKEDGKDDILAKATSNNPEEPFNMNALNSAIGNLINQTKKRVKSEKVTDGKQVATDKEVSDELGKKARQDAAKAEAEQKAAEEAAEQENTQAEEAPAEETPAEEAPSTENPETDNPETETAPETEETPSTEEAPATEETQTEENAEETNLDIIIESDDAEKVEEAIVNSMLEEKEKNKRIVLAKDIKEALVNRSFDRKEEEKDDKAYAARIHELIVKASHEAKARRDNEKLQEVV